jgi:hypothetical protein
MIEFCEGNYADDPIIVKFSMVRTGKNINFGLSLIVLFDMFFYK